MIFGIKEKWIQLLAIATNVTYDWFCGPGLIYIDIDIYIALQSLLLETESNL